MTVVTPGFSAAGSDPPPEVGVTDPPEQVGAANGADPGVRVDTPDAPQAVDGPEVVASGVGAGPEVGAGRDLVGAAGASGGLSVAEAVGLAKAAEVVGGPYVGEVAERAKSAEAGEEPAVVVADPPSEPKAGEEPAAVVVADPRSEPEAGEEPAPIGGVEDEALAPLVQRRRRESVLPVPLQALPSFPERPRRRRSWPGAVVTGAVASAPMVMMLVSVIAGGGPRTVSDDEALITLASRDVLRGRQLLGPYSRFGWHHPGPTYFFLLAVPTWIWRNTPTGPWVGATAIGVASVLGAALLARRYGGRRAGWWVAIGALAVVAGLGAGRLRDPWNPYAITLPLLFVAVAAVLAAAGSRGVMPWALVAGSFMVQTDVSSGPIVLGFLGIAAVAILVRRIREGRQGGEPIPPELPFNELPGRRRSWWRRRPGLILATILLVAEWSLPLWDEFFGTGNLSKIFTFFTTGHPGQSWSSSWHLTTAMVGITMFQHHQAIIDTVGDPHPLVTTIAFVGLCAFAIVGGVARRRPTAAWFGAAGLLSGALAVYSVTKVTGPPYHYLIVWMVVLPVVPLVGAALACEDLWCGFDLPWAAPGKPLALARPGPLVTAAAAVAVLVVAVRGAADAVPAVRLSDPDIAAAWQAIAPVVGSGNGAVRIELADGGRWPAAAGIALELEEHGHPARVDPEWTFMFGTDRRVRGDEAVDLVIATDQTAWPEPKAAVLLGQVGPEVLFVRREGTACSFAGLPFGGTACPVPAALSGPALPAPLGTPTVLPAPTHPSAGPTVTGPSPNGTGAAPGASVPGSTAPSASVPPAHPPAEPLLAAPLPVAGVSGR